MVDACPIRRLGLATLLLVLCTTAAVAQDEAARLQTEIKKVEAKIKEEQDRAAKKKEAVAVEFKTLDSADTKATLAKKLTELGVRYRAAVQEAAKAPPPPAGKPVVKPQIYTTVQTDVREAIATTVGRNLALVLDGPMSATLLTAFRGEGTIDYAAVVNESLADVFEGRGFEDNYKKMAPVFEKKLAEAQEELATLKRRVADLEATARSRALGAPPGMVLVPGGKYRIGTDADEQTAIRKALGYAANTGLAFQAGLGWPAQEVTIEDYYIDINEVTNRAYLEFVRDTGYQPPLHWVSPADAAGGKGPKAESAGQATSGPGPAPAGPAEGTPTPAGTEKIPAPGTEEHPVTYVRYEDAVAFCEWCGRRLPTEFEWEAAARAKAPNEKTARRWPWGDTYDLKNPACNNQSAAMNPARQGKIKLLPVGSFPSGKSYLGLNDMAGNALELTSSPFLAYPGFNPDKFPAKGAPLPEFSEVRWTIRGGGALHPDLCVLSSWRAGLKTQSTELVGFRMAASKAKGRDFLERVAGGSLLVAALKDAGPPLKDEKGYPHVALTDEARISGLLAGGWDSDKQVPAKARQIAIALRETLDFADASRMKALARDQKSPLMLGYLVTEVDFTNPPLPKGSYWITWSTGHTIVQGKDKIQAQEGLYLKSVKGDLIPVPGVNPVLVPKYSEGAKLEASKGKTMKAIMVFPVRDRKESRFIVEFNLETADHGLDGFK